MELLHRADSTSLTITRTLPASREAVFAAWTTAESVRQWMCPMPGSVAFVELDARVGGTFRVDMVGNGVRTTHTGVYREVTPPRTLVFTWKSSHTQDRDTLVNLELRAVGNQTELTLTHTLLPDEEAVRGHTWGWTGCLDHLADHLQTGSVQAEP